MPAAASRGPRAGAAAGLAPARTSSVPRGGPSGPPPSGLPTGRTRPRAARTPHARRGGPAARRARPGGRRTAARSPRRSGRAASRRRSWSRLPYATSWVSACLNVYSSSGNRLDGVEQLGGLEPRQAGLQLGLRRARRWPGAARTARPCRSRRPSGAAASPRAAGGRCGRPAPPGPSPAPGSPRPGRVSRYAPRSPTSAPVSTRARTLSSRKNGLPSVRSDQERLQRLERRVVARAARRAARRRSLGPSGSIRSWV